MSKPLLVQALLDLQLHMTISDPIWAERREICERIGALMDREMLLCDTREQHDWLVARAWSQAVLNSNSRRGRYAGRRERMSWDRIRAILAEVPKAE